MKCLSSEPLKQEAIRLGFDLVGVCDATLAPHLDEYRAWIGKGYHGTMDYLARQLPLKQSVENLLPGAKSVVAVGLNYCQPNPTETGRPRIASYALGRDYHRVVRGKLFRLGRWLDGYCAEEFNGNGEKAWRACVDSAPVFERDYAHLAGLGWFGKNTCLINTLRGSWFFIGLLITTVGFETDQPSIGGCGTCRKCIDACPTGALVFEDGRWQVDSRKCISYLTIEHKGEIERELSSKMGGWTFGCDVCQEVCPFNSPRDSQPLRAQPTDESDFLVVKTWPSLEEMADLDEGAWDAITQGSPVRRAGLAGLRRNAAINLRNLGQT